MSRLAKARRKKTRIRLFLLLVLLMCLAVMGGLAFFLADFSEGEAGSSLLQLVDREKTAVLIDFMGQTHVSVFLLDGVAVEEISADGIALRHSPESGAWYAVIQGLEPGEELEIIVTSVEGEERLELTVEQF